MHGGKHAHADHATYAAFWHSWLAQLDGGFISRGTSGVVGVLRRYLPLRVEGGATMDLLKWLRKVTTKEKVAHCTECGAPIPETTARRRGGLCKSCRRAKQRTLEDFGTSKIPSKAMPMGGSEEVRRMARQRAENYRKALSYLNGLARLTYTDFVKVIRIAGIEMAESEIQQTWRMSEMTIPGAEGLRQIYRETLEQGIAVFEKVARELPG